MKKTLELVVFAIVGVSGFILIFALIFWFQDQIRPRKLDEPDAIRKMENSDPEKYPEIKKRFSQIIEDEFGIVPEKVAFMVYAMHEASNYSVTVYYKYQSEWYWFEVSWLNSRIYGDLDEQLIHIASNG